MAKTAAKHCQNEKIQMEFELTVSALESKLWPRVFIEYSSTIVDLCLLIVFLKKKLNHSNRF